MVEFLLRELYNDYYIECLNNDLVDLRIYMMIQNLLFIMIKCVGYFCKKLL